MTKLNNLTKNQRLGIVACVVGVVIFIPLLFLAVGVQIWVDGQNVTAVNEAAAGMTLGMTFLNTLGFNGLYLFTGYSSFLLFMMGLGTLLVKISSIALIVVGVLLICGKADGLDKWIEKAVFVVGIIVATLAVVSILEVIFARPTEFFGEEVRLVIGFGSILMLFVGAGVIALSVFWDEVLAFVFGEKSDGPAEKKVTTDKKPVAGKKPVADNGPVVEKKDATDKKPVHKK